MSHGTRASYLKGCRCTDCGDAHRRYMKAYKHRARTDCATGKPAHPLRIPIDPVREHIRTLVASGWTLAQITRETGGMLRSHIYHINAGDYPTVHRDVAARILALQPLEPVRIDEVVAQRLADGADWRTVRCTRDERLAAAEILRRRGWPLKHIDEHLGLRSGRDYARKDDVV